VGTIAADNPWEFFHKVSFGHPGEPMPSGKALGWEMEQIANILAYAQTLPTK
jgi:thiosulfate dehydrogenase